MFDSNRKTQTLDIEKTKTKDKGKQGTKPNLKQHRGHREHTNKTKEKTKPQPNTHTQHTELQWLKEQWGENE